MNSRTSIVYGTGERVGHVECTPVQGDVDGRYALHIGYHLTLIADLDELVQLAENISYVVNAMDLPRRRDRDDIKAVTVADLDAQDDDDIEADRIEAAAVADLDAIVEATKND